MFYDKANRDFRDRNKKDLACQDVAEKAVLFPGRGEGTQQTLYGEAPPRCPNPLYTIFDRKGTPFVYLP